MLARITLRLELGAKATKIWGGCVIRWCCISPILINVLLSRQDLHNPNHHLTIIMFINTIFFCHQHHPHPHGLGWAYSKAGASQWAVISNGQSGAHNLCAMCRKHFIQISKTTTWINVIQMRCTLGEEKIAHCIHSYTWPFVSPPGALKSGVTLLCMSVPSSAGRHFHLWDWL